MVDRLISNKPQFILACFVMKPGYSIVAVVLVYQQKKVMRNLFYYIDKSVLVESRPLVKFIRNYIRDSSGVFSISSLVRISMTSCPTFTLLFVQNYSCLYNKKKITRWLEDMNFIFSW